MLRRRKGRSSVCGCVSSPWWLKANTYVQDDNIGDTADLSYHGRGFKEAAAAEEKKDGTVGEIKKCN